MKVPCLQIFIRWSKYNSLMLNMVSHTLLIYLTVHSEGSTVCVHAGKYAYHFRHIVEMFWAPMHGAQVPKVWALQKHCILWHSSRKTDSRLRSGCTVIPRSLTQHHSLKQGPKPVQFCCFKISFCPILSRNIQYMFHTWFTGQLRLQTQDTSVKLQTSCRCL